MMTRKPSSRRPSAGGRATGGDRQGRQPDSDWDDEFETVAPRKARLGGTRSPDADTPGADAGRDPARDPAGSSSGRQPPKGPSLKARAVGYLSRREHARSELARKLRPHAEDPADIDAVLDELQREGWLSNERFAQSLVHRRAPQRGTARVVQELKQHGVDENQVAELREQLRATEYERAQAAWQKRFGGDRPADRAEYARQARFLAGRGFAHDVIRRLLGASDDE